jgi:transcription-repair coupling factor (superfamily II helicase)
VQTWPITVSANLFKIATQTPNARDFLRRLEKGGVLSCAGVSLGAQPFLTALLRLQFPQRAIVVVTDGLKRQECFQQDTETWHRLAAQGDLKSPTSDFKFESPLFYPAWENLPQEGKLPHVDVISERLQTLVTIGQAKHTNPPRPLTIITSIVALLQRTFEPADLRIRTRALKKGDRLDPLDLIEWLEEQGYEPEAQVTQKGEIALRGGILDLYPLASPWPVRLEFFGDELESLRYFDPFTQISKEEIADVTVPPGGELGILRKRFAPRDDQSDQSQTSANRGDSELGSLLDHLPPQTVFALCEPDLLSEQARNYAAQIPADDPFFIAWDEFLEQMEVRGHSRLDLTEAPPDFAKTAIAASLETGSEQSEAPASDANPATTRTGEAGPSLSAATRPTFEETGAQKPSFDLGFASLEAFRPLQEPAREAPIAEAQRREFFNQLHRWLRQGYAVQIFCNNDGEKQRFDEIWREYGLDQASPVPLPAKSSAPRPSGVASEESGELEARARASTTATETAPGVIGPAITLGALSRGFVYDEGRLVVVTDAEVFGRYKVQRARRLKSPHALAMRSALDIDFTELEEGDYVVHLQYGIGRYHGLQVLPASAGRRRPEAAEAASTAGQECLVIEYAPNDPDQPPPKLYVPVTEAHLVSKYVGAGKARPPLHTLGGSRWAKAKIQAQEAVRDLASEMLAIQAARASQPGHACRPDTPWQREFEGAFLFEETPDQHRAIEETKRDLEAPRPMDRLICGDVGFGKTEVALRAAFKVVMEGNQVAILVPTTVLAQQHFNTFRERLADYPIRVELLSRYRTRREQQRVVTDLATGGVDIVIGTHRLLQEDLQFKDLGLVVIDEEQRFGVQHKERFKQMRRLVDVLTLSATPIPRTLYLALTGARDMSTIETPPHDRLPVETLVIPYDERVIRDAIQRELNRQGQVFFLHNRVDTIEVMAQRLRDLVPRARIVVGHGQMDSDELEGVMTQFVNGEADILLSTTIIESGLDIPNANTIIIDRADRFGLSDLYQLRGRVGRYKHQAYAYLLMPRHAGVLSDARKRLSAIKQFSSLGSGFKIAMRDLELRGAGNLLGAQQSGHITAVGFELYCQLLKQSVSALKGEPVKPRIEVQVRLDFLSLNPSDDAADTRPTKREKKEPRFEVSVPRDVVTYLPQEAPALEPAPIVVKREAACLPFSYVADSRQRVEIYRKLAQAAERADLNRLREECRDRFGALPPAAELLFQVGELKILAASKAITDLETRQDKLMLQRNRDYLTVGEKFPRLTKKSAKARLNEIKKLLLSL